MKKLIAVGVALLVASALAPAAADAATDMRCKSVEDIGPAGREPSDGNGIRARRTSCRTARRVVRRSTGPMIRAISRSDDGVVESYRVLRWTCRYQALPGFVTVCHPTNGAAKRIRWHLGR